MTAEWDLQKHKTRLGKTVTYILRYGAEKEGLTVHEGGYIDFMDLANVPLLKSYKRDHLLQVIRTSKSYRGPNVFETINRDNTIYVRATHFRRFERSPHHEGTKVCRLLETCMTYVCDNILKFDFNGFPDEFIINSILHRLKRQHKLNNKSLQCLLSESMEYLDLEGVYLTAASFRMVSSMCVNLRVLSLKNCGYVVTDNILQNLLKNIQNLETLNLMLCKHLKDKSLNIITKYCKSLNLVNLCGIQFSEGAIINFVKHNPNINHLDIWGIRNISDSAIATLIDLACSQHITIVHHNIKDERVVPACPNTNLSINNGLVT